MRDETRIGKRQDKQEKKRLEKTTQRTTSQDNITHNAKTTPPQPMCLGQSTTKYKYNGQSYNYISSIG